MNIAFILPSLNTTAPIKLTNIIVNSLVSNNIDIDIDIDIYYFNESIDKVLFNTNTYHINFFSVFNYNKYDIIHSVMFRPDLYVLYHRKKIGNIRCISSIHQYISQNLQHSYSKLYSIIFTPLWHTALNSFDDLIVLSEDMYEYYSEISTPKKHVVYNGLNKSKILLNNEISKKITYFIGTSKIIGCIGGLTTTKGFDQVINIIFRLKNIKLIIIGSGKEKEKLKKLAIFNKCKEKVLFLGHVENAASYMGFFDVVLIPSRSEGFPLVLLEAIAQKIKILCSNIPTFKELFEENEIEFFNLEDLEDLELKIINTLNTSYNDKAFIKYKNNFTEEKMINKYLKIYKKGAI